MKELEKCELCPWKCRVNRNQFLGRCGAGKNIKIALASLHYFEEPCISGKSGTVFFSGCNLKCVYCQNYKISHLGYGKEITIEHLADVFISQQEKGANNLNLVTPTMYVPHIISALKIAKEKGLHIPVIYNSSGYESVETLRLLDGYIDVYLPDFKYYFSDIAKKYSSVSNYFEITSKAILEMYHQVGNAVFDENGMIQKGIIIRHMILPDCIENSKKVLEWIKENLSNQVYISIMAQYFPTYKACEYREINRKINQDELNEVWNFVEKLGFENGYIQELGEHEEEYVPDFDLSE
ncbi:MAG: radical SAM protein [Clostridia bacterium]|nr:radical SAM protein [Clostridia bacterium]